MADLSSFPPSTSISLSLSSGCFNLFILKVANLFDSICLVLLRSAGTAYCEADLNTESGGIGQSRADGAAFIGFLKKLPVSQSSTRKRDTFFCLFLPDLAGLNRLKRAPSSGRSRTLIIPLAGAQPQSVKHCHLFHKAEALEQNSLFF